MLLPNLAIILYVTFLLRLMTSKYEWHEDKCLCAQLHFICVLKFYLRVQYPKAFLSGVCMWCIILPDDLRWAIQILRPKVSPHRKVSLCLIYLCAPKVSGEFKVSSAYSSLCPGSPSATSAFIWLRPRETSKRRHSRLPNLKVEPDSLGLMNNERRGVFFLHIFFPAAFERAFGGGLIWLPPRAVVWGRRPRPDFECRFDRAVRRFSHRRRRRWRLCMRWRVEF